MTLGSARHELHGKYAGSYERLAETRMIFLRLGVGGTFSIALGARMMWQMCGIVGKFGITLRRVGYKRNDKYRTNI